MKIRHLVIATLLASAGAAQAAAEAAAEAAAISGADVVVIPAPAALTLTESPVTITPPMAAVPAATEVPEPSSLALLLAGVIGAGALRRRSK